MDHSPVCTCGAELLDQDQVAEVVGMTRSALQKATSRGRLTLPAPVLGGGQGVRAYWCAALVGDLAWVVSETPAS